MKKTTPSSSSSSFSIGKPFSNDFGTIYFLKDWEKLDRMEIVEPYCQTLEEEKNPYSAPNKVTLVLSKDAKASLCKKLREIKKEVADWMGMDEKDPHLAAFNPKESLLQTISLSKKQLECPP